VSNEENEADQVSETQGFHPETATEENLDQAPDLDADLEEETPETETELIVDNLVAESTAREFIEPEALTSEQMVAALNAEDYKGSELMDVLAQLEAMITQARSLPMSALVLVNKAEAISLLESARAAMPSDIRTANQIVAGANAVIERAQEESQLISQKANSASERIQAEAHARAEELVNQERIVVMAKERAEQIVQTLEEHFDQAEPTALVEPKQEPLPTADELGARLEEFLARNDRLSRGVQLGRMDTDFQRKSPGDISSLRETPYERRDRGTPQVPPRSRGRHRAED